MLVLGQRQPSGAPPMPPAQPVFGKVADAATGYGGRPGSARLWCFCEFLWTRRDLMHLGYAWRVPFTFRNARKPGRPGRPACDFARLLMVDCLHAPGPSLVEQCARFCIGAP